MRISILTFDAFNDLDSLVAFGMLSRIALLGDTAARRAPRLEGGSLNRRRMSAR